MILGIDEFGHAFKEFRGMIACSDGTAFPASVFLRGVLLKKIKLSKFGKVYMRRRFPQFRRSIT